jgi:PhnB protein
MSKKVSPIPRGYRTATPCLTVYDVDSAVAFYQAAFGAEMLTRHTGVDEFVAVHATIKIGNSIIALNQQAPEQGILSPVTMNVSTSQTHLYVDDVDANWNRAVEAGAIVRTPLFDAYWGDRTGTLVDGNGHLWALASKIENLSQEEIAIRAKGGDVAAEEFIADSEILVEAYAIEAPVLEETVAV